MMMNREKTGYFSEKMLVFFQSPFFLSLTVGVPFCIFKLLFGILAVRVGTVNNEDFFYIGGFLIIIWASLDLIMNLIRAGSNLIGEKGSIEFCTLAQVGKYLRVPSIFLAFDTLITFSIICTVLWSGWIVHLTEVESWFWYGATTLNLISLSLVSLYIEISRHRREVVKNL